MKPYPRANISEGDGVALSADLYNRMVEDLERLDRLAVMPPLTLTSGASGATIGMMSPANQLALVAITGTESGGGRYQGSILYGNSTGSTSTNFQLDGSEGQAATDGPAVLRVTGGGAAINNALVINVREPYVNQSHMLYNQTGSLFYCWGRVMGMTAETRPRTIVYVNDWPMSPAIAKITAPYPTTYGGVYYGRFVQGQFCNNSNFGYDFAMSGLASGFLPSVDTCWITNQWEQTYGTPNANALTVGTYVWGLTCGFPVYSVVNNQSSTNTWYQLFTWFPPQSATLSYPPQAPTIGNLMAGSNYTSNEKTMLNDLKADVTNLYNTLNNLYANLKQAGYSK